jgi:ABC-type nitrate/sulfonate/bicarbonate transport system permease component|nr:transporter permease [Aeromicrobium sp.]
MSLLRTIAYAVTLPLLLILAWWLLTINSTNFFVPRPGPLASTFVDTWFSERFTTDVVPSLTRFAIGVTLAIVLGIASGLVIGTFSWVRRFCEPLLEFFRAVPPPVLVPVFLVVLGASDTMKVAVIVSGAVWPVLLNTVEGVRSVDSVLSDTCRSYRVHGAARFRHLVLRSASPQIMAGVRQALSIGLILMVISEMFASSSGLGFTIIQFQRSFAVDAMWSGILVLGLIGVLLSFLFHLVERRVLSWYHSQREVQRGR